MEKSRLVAIDDGVTARVRVYRFISMGGMGGIVRFNGTDNEGRPFELVVDLEELEMLLRVAEELKEELSKTEKADEEGG